MNPFDRFKRLHREVFVRTQEGIAEEEAAQAFIEKQEVTRDAMKAASETIHLANRACR